MRNLKIAVYTIAKYLGAFWISRQLMRRRLLILAYHGFQYEDEAAFRPILFMDPSVFARRLAAIQRGDRCVRGK